MAARGYMAAGSRICVDHSSGSTDDRSEAPGSMIDILTHRERMQRTIMQSISPGQHRMGSRQQRTTKSLNP